MVTESTFGVRFTGTTARITSYTDVLNINIKLHDHKGGLIYSSRVRVL